LAYRRWARRARGRADLVGGQECIPATLTDPNNPNCVVEDVTSNPDGTKTAHQLPECQLDMAGSGFERAICPGVASNHCDGVPQQTTLGT
jgi:hypothetical protein